MRRGLTAAGAAILLAVGIAVGTHDSPVLPGAAVCDVTISTPAPDRSNAVAVRNGDSLTVSITGKTSRCLGATVTFSVSENGAGEVSKGTTTADGTTGAWSKSLSLTDAKSSKFFARMTGGGKTTEASRIFVADTGKPKLVINAPSATAFGVLNVGAPPACGGANIHVVAGDPGWVNDSDCADGGQVQTSFTVTGASGGAVRVTYQGAEVFDSGVSNSPQTFTPTLTLPDFTRGDLVFSAVNGTGTTSITDLTRVQTAIPPAVLGPDGGINAFVSRIVDARAATVELDFVLPTIPTTVESASIELEWTTGVIAPPPGTPLAAAATGWVVNHAYVAGDITSSGGRNCIQTVASCTSNAVSGNQGCGLGVDGGDNTCRWDYVSTVGLVTHSDGGFFSLDHRDLEDVTLGTNRTTRTYDPRVFKSADGRIERGNGGFSNGGLIMQIPNDCVLYDPTEVPQTWDCRDGKRLVSGSVRTATFVRLPPINTYYFWVQAVY